MDAEPAQERALSFGANPAGYDDHRPDYPAEAVRWLVGSNHARILELGSGTGKLTRAMLALGHDVVATDPSPQMLSLLRRQTPKAHVTIGRAEDIPLASSSVDLVVAGQAFHWFDRERALPEIARVLRPGGFLCLAWNRGDHKVPWVRRLFALMDITDRDAGADPVAGSELFATSDQRVFRHWQDFYRDGLIGLVASSSKAGTLTAAERSALLDEVAELYDGYGRGPDGMRMPWMTYCYRARVTGLANFRRDTDEDPDDGLLIDFS